MRYCIVEPNDCVYLGGKHPIEWSTERNVAWDCICDWCQNQIEHYNRGNCIMGCDVDICRTCYNIYRNEGLLKNFIIFGHEIVPEEDFIPMPDTDSDTDND
jgi:hypothetical protein